MANEKKDLSSKQKIELLEAKVKDLQGLLIDKISDVKGDVRDIKKNIEDLYKKEQTNEDMFASFDNFMTVLTLNTETIIKMMVDKKIFTLDEFREAADAVANEMKQRNEEQKARIQSESNNESSSAK